MNKKLLIAILISIFTLCEASFSYKWVRVGEDYYLQEDNVAICKTNFLLNENDAVYYFDSEGKMCKGWFYNPINKNAYFFDNNPESIHYGQMVFGLKTIDGLLRYFDEGGILARSEKQDTYVKVFGEYWADFEGNLYYDNKLQIDTSENRSDYYTNIEYYSNYSLNNSTVILNNIDTWGKDMVRQENASMLVPTA